MEIAKELPPLPNPYKRDSEIWLESGGDMVEGLDEDELVEYGLELKQSEPRRAVWGPLPPPEDAENLKFLESMKDDHM